MKEALIEPISIVNVASSKRAWLVVLTAALFFFYEFIQMNMFNAISDSLMRDFNIGARQLGIMSSFYFIANVIFLFPAGIFLDRCATRKVILTALSVCILGTALMSFTYSFSLACVFRFLTGIGSAFCFLSVIRLASRWFPAKRMALVTGLVVTMAMIGGLVAQTPMTLLLQWMDWRTALLWDATLGVVILFLIATIVKDYPEEHGEIHQQEQDIIKQIGFWKSLRLAFIRKQNWLCGAYTCLMNLPVGLLGGLWGILYLVDTRGLDHLQAANVTSMLFLGTVIGSPLAGWISDTLMKRRLPMRVGAFLSLIVILLLLNLPHLSFMALLIFFLLIGIITATQIISYPLVAESSDRIITAMSVSAVNISVQGGTAIFQPIFGYLMDQHAFSRVHQTISTFLAADFQWAMWLFPIGFLLAVVITFALKEYKY